MDSPVCIGKEKASDIDMGSSPIQMIKTSTSSKIAVPFEAEDEHSTTIPNIPTSPQHNQ